MNKQELITAIAEGADISKIAAGKALDALTSTITTSLTNGEEVALIGFGTFKVSDRAERKGRNPSTGAEIVIKASKSPGFKAGKALKDAVNS